MLVYTREQIQLSSLDTDNAETYSYSNVGNSGVLTGLCAIFHFSHLFLPRVKPKADLYPMFCTFLK